ncbi:MAG: cyclic pyranopterin monophosphate synthase MoaC, partial [Phycisphaerae bacterium]|jgi:cyclic pyranopterin phosphate synthase|nr:cyclic pyranopterin monophosphate synthase MoaC [Phycisphaerae bacterium]
MVNVGGKRTTRRRAVARGRISLKAATIKKIRENKIKKGGVIETARIAGIQAAKRTAELIPLCHTLALDSADVRIELDEKGADIEATVLARERTGVEMEALTAVAVAALTIYDMVKAVDRVAVISDIRLVKKTGGKSDFGKGR